MTVLTEKDHAFFRENGYIVVKQAVPKENCERVVDAMWAFLGKDPGDRASWYTPPSGMDSYMFAQGIGGVEMYHHQAMWDNRQHPRLYQAFAEIWGEEKLFVSMDKVGMKPPANPDYSKLNHSFIHWDLDTSDLPSPLPRPIQLQGVLMLEDTAENQGGFQCVPALYRDLEEWLKRQPADRNPKRPGDLTGYEIVKVFGEAGDLIIFDSLLAHGNGENLADRPRVAQYITMNPAQPDDASRDMYVQCWRENNGHPSIKKGVSSYSDPRHYEANTYTKPAELTPLGRKLLGLDSWFE